MNMNNTGTFMHTGHTGMEAAGFAALWNPGLILVVLIIGWLYAMAVNRWRHQFAESSVVTIGQQIYFFSGLFLYYIAEGTPLSYYSHHYSFSAHMLQQSILYMVVPPLVLLGLPGWLLRPLFKPAAMKLFMRLFASPLISLFVFNMVFSFYHIPLIMDKLMTNDLLHGLYNAVFLLSAFQLWFQVFCPLAEYDRLSELRKMGYIFVNGILLTPACALIIFAGQPIYASYAGVPEQFLFMSVIDDQQLGGVIMKIIQELVYGIALAYVFFRWYRRERKEEEEEDLRNESYNQPSVQTN
jgi:putative membrane protein